MIILFFCLLVYCLAIIWAILVVFFCCLDLGYVTFVNGEVSNYIFTLYIP